MVPAPNWAQEAKSFDHALPPEEPQQIICVMCFNHLGIDTPPKKVVIRDGNSLCIDHLRQVQSPL